MCVWGGARLTPKMPSLSPDCCLLRAVEVRLLSFCVSYISFWVSASFRLLLSFYILRPLLFEEQLLSLWVVRHRGWRRLKNLSFSGDQSKKTHKISAALNDWGSLAFRLEHFGVIECLRPGLFKLWHYKLNLYTRTNENFFVMICYVGCVHTWCVGLIQ